MAATSTIRSRCKPRVSPTTRSAESLSGRCDHEIVYHDIVYTEMVCRRWVSSAESCFAYCRRVQVGVRFGLTIPRGRSGGALALSSRPRGSLCCVLASSLTSPTSVDHPAPLSIADTAASSEAVQRRHRAHSGLSRNGPDSWGDFPHGQR